MKNIQRIFLLSAFLALTHNSYADSSSLSVQQKQDKSFYQTAVDKAYSLKQKWDNVDEHTKQAVSNFAYSTMQALLNNYANPSPSEQPNTVSSGASQQSHAKPTSNSYSGPIQKEPSQQHYYEALGLSSDASQADIRKAYLKLARQYHPDKNRASHAIEKFNQINEAYNALTK